MSKQVLVNYSERNKILKIPDVHSVGGSDLEYLETQFIKDFNFQSNVKLLVSFQRYDEDWNEYVEIDKNTTVKHKEKLKAVVTPLLEGSSSQTATSTRMSTASSSTAATPVCDDFGGSSELIEFGYDSDTSSESVVNPLYSPSEIDTAHSLGKRKIIQPSPQQKESEAATPKRAKIVKSNDDSVPLPNPFPLPNHYRSDVESGLNKGQMTSGTQSAFITAVASSMLHYKRYPTRDDYLLVARTIVEKYKFMSSPIGTPYGAVLTSLVNRFKEFRRPPKTTSTSGTAAKTTPKQRTSPKKRLPGITQVPSKPIVDLSVDDQASYQRHNEQLKKEFKKSVQNEQVVYDLMDKSFPFRRAFITNSPIQLTTLFKEFPYLQKGDHIMRELERVVDQKDLRITCQQKWKAIYPRVLTQAKLETRRKSVKYCLDVGKDLKGSDNSQLLALMSLVSLLPDSNSKLDVSKVVYLALESSDAVRVAEAHYQLEPYILVLSHPTSDMFCCYLVVDKQIVDTILVEDLPFALLSAFFVYNIHYPKGCINFYTMLEIIGLQYSSEKASTTVKYLISKIFV